MYYLMMFLGFTVLSVQYAGGEIAPSLVMTAVGTGAVLGGVAMLSGRLPNARRWASSFDHMQH